MRALVAGWFSFDLMGATAGDLLSRDVVCGWLEQQGIAYDVAGSASFPGCDWRNVDPAHYSHVIFVCGPLGNGEPVTEFFARFDRHRLVGVNVSMLDPLDTWNPFDLLLERDSSHTSRPDLAFLHSSERVPVVGLVLVHEQKEYAGGMHREVHAAIREFLGNAGAATLEIDTCLDPPNVTGFRSPAEIVSAIAKVDVVVTTRLHGLVLGLSSGVPVLAIDPVRGGAKIARQAATVGWPVVVAENVSRDVLAATFAYCVTPEARDAAVACASRARDALDAAPAAFAAEFSPVRGA